MRTVETRIKAASKNAEAVKAVTDALLDQFEGYSSPLLSSDGGGWHCFLTLQVEVDRRG